MPCCGDRSCPYSCYNNPSHVNYQGPRRALGSSSRGYGNTRTIRCSCGYTESYVPNDVRCTCNRRPRPDPIPHPDPRPRPPTPPQPNPRPPPTPEPQPIPSPHPNPRPPRPATPVSGGGVAADTRQILLRSLADWHRAREDEGRGLPRQPTHYPFSPEYMRNIFGDRYENITPDEYMQLLEIAAQMTGMSQR